MPSAVPSLPALDGWRLGGRTFQHHGYDIFYRDDGLITGEVLLCMHGFPTSSWDWHRLWPDLCERWRVIAVDMIGYGFSDKPPGYSYSLMDQADLLEELLHMLEVKRVHILAHDVGDSVAQELLARHAEQAAVGKAPFAIESVCLLNGGLFPETHRPTTMQKLLASRLGFLVSRLMTERSFVTAFAAVFGPRTKPSTAELHEFWTLIAFNRGNRISHKLIAYIGERRRHRQRWVGALHSNVPILVINGSSDPVSGAHMVVRLREEIPDVPVISLPEVGHYPQIEAPGDVIQAYLKFRTD